MHNHIARETPDSSGDPDRFLGLVLAVPLLAFLMIAVRAFYVEDVIER